MNPSRRFAIVLTPHARQQLEDEMAWSRRRWGRRHQQSFRQRLVARLDVIAANPYGHAVRDGLGDAVRLARQGGLLIAYTVDEPGRRIVVLAFPNVHRELGASVAEAVARLPPDGDEDG